MTRSPAWPTEAYSTTPWAGPCARDHAGACRALLLLDLDGFKAVNDTLGHLTGDEVLVKVAGAVSAAVREGDVPARLGGDEFAVVLPETSETQAMKVAERVLRGVRKDRYLTSLDAKVAVSVGVAWFEDPTSGRALVGAADAALYRAKRAGGNVAELATTADLAGTAAVPGGPE